VPGPVLRFREGEEAVVRVTNRLDATTSIHWHGLLVDGAYDGAPGFNGFNGIAPGRPTPIASASGRAAPIGITPTAKARNRPANMARC
jgi:FtsP/CotA-like multicopper oxidase with cupredoxin domain